MSVSQWVGWSMPVWDPVELVGSGASLEYSVSPFCSGVRCVAIDIKGAEWFFGKEPVLSLGLTHDMFLGFCVYASRRLVSRDR